MPIKQFSPKVDLDYLHPEFLRRLLDLLAEARLLGYTYKVYSGYRSTDEQRVLHKLYLQGGNKAAPAGLSAHNYGLAIDCGRLMPDGKVSWLDADLEPLRELCLKHTLDWGGFYADKPHIGLPGFVNGAQLLPLKQVYNNTLGDERTKINAVWATVDATLKP